MKKFLSTTALAVALVAPTAAWAELRAVASFSILGDIVAQVGGDLVEVTTIVGADQDAHVYIPNVSDARAVAAADLVFLNGLGFETWAADLVAGSGTAASIVSVAESLPLEIHSKEEEGHDDHDDHAGHDDHDEHKDHDDHSGHDDHDEHKDHDDHSDHDDHDDHGEEEMDAHAHHDHGEEDPHAWGAMINAIAYADAVRDAFSAADPANAAAYEANFAAFEAEGLALRDAFLARIAALPADGTVITSHDAFGYLAEETGLTFLAPLGLNSAAAASASEVRELIQQLKSLPNAALFVENITNSALIEQIGVETSITVNTTPLYSDALSGAEGPAATYLDYYRHNLETILAALEAN